MVNYNKISILLLFSISILLFSACTTTVRFSSDTGHTNTSSTSTQKTNNTEKIDAGTTFRGVASYYNDKFDGKQTASGEIFRQKLLTGAHRTLPFGTIVKVTRVSNGKSVTVRINDRGPFVDGRIIDLSYAAALALDLIKDGIAEVIVEVSKE